jgi:hypothetical protein
MYLRVIAVFRLWIANTKRAVVKQLLKLKIRFQIVFLIKASRTSTTSSSVSTILTVLNHPDLLFLLFNQYGFTQSIKPDQYDVPTRIIGNVQFF